MAGKRKKLWSRKKRQERKDRERVETLPQEEPDYDEVFHIDAPFEEIMARVMQVPNSALKTPLVEDDESINGASG